MFPLFFNVGSRRVPDPIEAFLNRPKTPEDEINLQERERGKRGESRLEKGPMMMMLDKRMTPSQSSTTRKE